MNYGADIPYGDEEFSAKELGINMIGGFVSGGVLGAGSSALSGIGRSGTQAELDAEAGEALKQEIARDAYRNLLGINTQGRSISQRAPINATSLDTVNTSEVGGNRITAGIPYTAEEAKNITKESKKFIDLVASKDIGVLEFFEKWSKGRKSNKGEKLEKLYC